MITPIPFEASIPVDITKLNPKVNIINSTENNSTIAYNNNLYHLDPYPYYGNISNNFFHPKKLFIKGPPTGIVFKDPMGRYGNFDIYEKDQAPYYGTIYEYRKISNIPYNKFLKVPIEIKDLDEFYNEKLIKNQLKDKENNNNIIKEEYYHNDPKPYYDASFLDREIKKNLLNKIKQDKISDLKFGTQKILLEKLKEKIKIQNYKNADKEENNKVNRVYYTETDRYKFKRNNITYTNSTSSNHGLILTTADEVKHNTVEVDVV